MRRRASAATCAVIEDGPAFLAGLAILLSVSACGSSSSPASSELRACDYRLDSAYVLSLPDSATIYIEPSAVSVAREGSALIGGFPNLLSRPGAEVERDRLFGVVVSPGDRISPIARPPQIGFLNNARSASTDREWLVSFGASDRDPPNRSYEHLVVATYPFAAQRWTRVDTLTPPSGYRIGYIMSRLVANDRIAAIAVEAELSTRERGVVVFTKLADRWSSEFVPTGDVAYLELGLGARGGLVMVAVVADTSRGTDTNSLLVFRGPQPWQRLGFVPKALGYAAAHAPRLVTRGDSVFIGFVDHGDSVRSVKVVTGPEGGPYRLATADSSGWTVTPVLGQPALWVTQGASSVPENSTIAIAEVEMGASRRVFALDSRESGWLAATSVDGMINLIQPILRSSKEHSALVTRVMKLSPICRMQ